MNFSLVQKTRVLAGAKSSRQTGLLLKEAGYKKAFVVYDAGVKQAGITEAILKSMEENQVEYVCFDRVKSDPPAGIVEEAAAICKAERCDCVVAIGGGSSIDTAKGVTVLRFNDGKILDYGKPGAEMRPCSGLISIPTTSGTGSELSDGLIITDTEHGVKVPILALNAMSEYAILDPELTYGVPERMTAATGLDVFSHAAEAYTSVKATILTDVICEKIMELVVRWLPKAVHDPQDKTAREKMAVASTLAGWMLGQASAHAGHSVAHVLGARFHMVHGEACAYVLPGLFMMLSDTCPEKLKYVGALLGAEFDGDSSEQIGTRAAEAYKKFRDETVGIRPVNEYGVVYTEEVEEDCVNAVMAEPFVALSPKPVTRSLAKELVYRALN